MNVLSVDDSEQNRYLVESILTSSGYTVTSAKNGKEALDALGKGRFDLIVSDILMPLVDGFELCREVKKDSKLAQIPFVFYSATYTDARDKALALGLGADAFLVKPAEPEVFLGTLTEVISQARLHPRPVPAIESDQEFVEQHHSRIIQKLEAKLEQLRQSNAALLESEQSVKLLNEDLRRANVVLKEREATIQISQRVGKIGSWELEIEARQFTGSEQLFKILGLPAVPISFDTLLARVIHPDDVDRVKAAYQQCLDGGRFNGIEHRILAGDNVIRHVYSMGELVLDRAGEPRRVIGCLQDITDRKHAEEARSRLEFQLHHSQKMEAVGTLAGGIAHDFNNVLAAVIGHAELLRLDLKSRNLENAGESISMILDASHRAKDLVRQILSFSRKQALERQLTELGSVIRDGMKMIRATIPSNIQIDLRLEEHGAKILADKGQLQQVLLNLCANAAQAIGDRPGMLSVHCTRVDSIDVRPPLPGFEKRRELACLTVRDTGCGMSSETAARVFEPFFTTKAPGQGTGLGLSVVHSIIANHDGLITVSSRPGEGSVFNVYFPAVEGEPQVATPPPAVLSRGAGELVMFVDDESSVIHIGRRALEYLGYRVEAFNNPEQALTAFNAAPGRFVAVITDLTMPHLNGIDLLKQLKARNPSVPVILTTGFSGSIDQAKARDLGFSDLLGKPFLLATLSECLAASLKKK